MAKRSPDVANVFWDSSETLRCLQCTSPITPRFFPDGSSTFFVWFTSNEDAGVYCREIPKDAMPRFTFYKFCSEQCCREFVQRIGGNLDYKALAEAALARAGKLPSSRFILGGLYLGMPIEDAIALINVATGNNYRVRQHGKTLVFSKTSNIDYPCNPVSLRAIHGGGSELVELRLDADILHAVLLKYESTYQNTGGCFEYLKTTTELYELLEGNDPGSSRWLVGFPEKGVRMYVCNRPASGKFRSLAAGSIVLRDYRS